MRVIDYQNGLRSCNKVKIITEQLTRIYLVPLTIISDGRDYST